MSRLYLVRHGETNRNVQGRIRGWDDAPDTQLTADGQAEAHLIGSVLSRKPLDIIVTSDLGRAAQTAHIISQVTGKPIVETTQDLRPWNLGHLTGQESTKVAGVMKNFVLDNPDEPIPDGESFSDFKRRFLSGLDRIVGQYAGKNIAIVAHHRNERLLSAWMKAGANPDGSIKTSEMMKEGAQPGSVTTYEVGGKKNSADLQPSSSAPLSSPAAPTQS